MLVLAYYFPPLGGAGVQRTLKHVRYLADHGWSATVVTGRPGSYPAEDSSLLDEVPPGAQIVRARNVRLAWFVSLVLGKLGLRGAAELLRWPDGGLGWGPFALVAAARAVRRERPDVLLSSSPPYAGHLVAYLLHRWTGIPWVADFRDEWSADPHQRSLPRFVRRMTERAERRLVTAASEVIVVGDYFEIAGEPARRTTITNGVDPVDFAAAPPGPAPRDRMRISYVGTLYGERDCAPVLGALRALAASGRLPGEEIEFCVVGNVWLPDADRLLPPNAVQTGYVDHAEALAQMRSSDVLLFYAPLSTRAPSGKLYEYLASERPILCVARPDNPAHRLVAEWDAGIAVAPDDAAGIEEALVALHRRWRDGGLPDVHGARERTFAQFSREQLAAALAGVLDRAA